MSPPPFLTRAVFKNYKSIASCDVQLGPLMFLVGRNGSGKSNFLDGLRFVADALRTSLDHAVRERGGINEVRRRSSGHPTHFGIRLEFGLESGVSGHYAFEIAARPQGGFEVQDEECVVRPPGATFFHFFRVVKGVVTATSPVAPPAAQDRLYLVNAAGLPPFRPVYEALSRMAFYNLNPDRIRDYQPPDAGELLARDGSNIAAVIGHLARHNSDAKRRIEDYLIRVAPGVEGVDVKEFGSKETLEFRQQVAGAKAPWRFLATNMSDGTLRALGVLVALFQSTRNGGPAVPLVGLEEPEVALHPAAAGVLLDSLHDASQRTQVIVTSHSPDLLDEREIDADSLLAVSSVQGVTTLVPVDAISREILREGLYTAGELLRTAQLLPDPGAMQRAATKHLSLFGQGGP